jgi:hypothetical protein
VASKRKRVYDPEYNRRHRNVYRARGKAKKHVCVGCGSAAQEWAQKHGTDGEDPSHYDPMCCSCHGKYDDHWNAETRAKVSATSKLRMQDPAVKAKAVANLKRDGKHTPEAIEKIRASKTGVPNLKARGQKRTPEQRERMREGIRRAREVRLSEGT